MRTPKFWNDFPLGMVPITSRLIEACWETFRTSTTGEAPVTVIVSSTEPTVSCASMFAVNPELNSTPSRIWVLNPERVKVTEYTPDCSAIIKNWPALSVTAVRTSSMSTGLRAWTVTPGSTPPVVSVTAPPIAWADAVPGMSININMTSATRLRCTPTHLRCFTVLSILP